MILSPHPRHFLGLFLLLTIAATIGKFYFDSEQPWNERIDKDRRYITSAPAHRDIGRFDMSPVVVIGSDYNGEKDTILTNHSIEFVLILPHKLEYNLKTKGVEALASNDYESVQQLARFLDDNQEFDAATGVIMDRKISATPDALFKKSACRYLTKNWTLLIHNTGPMPIFVNYKSGAEPLYVQRCNFAETAFLIRKEVFQSIGWRPEFGKTSLLDFFLRSEGRLKLAKLSGVIISTFLNRVDRGKLEMKMEFTDYAEFGQRHSILRIVYPNRIEWIKCADDAELCPEKPTTLNTGQYAEIKPICCSVVMNELLVSFTSALGKLDVDYRLVYGTLLGAVRSQAIIPYTDDVDIAFHKKDNENLMLFAALQELTGPRFNVILKMREPRPVSNVLAHFTPTLFTDTSKYFKKDDNFEGRALFTKEIFLQMKKLLPIENTGAERRFLDVYPSPEEWFATPASVVIINGRKYLGMKNPDKALAKWYGEDYMAPNTAKHSITSFV